MKEHPLHVQDYPEFEAYPDEDQVATWLAEIRQLASDTACQGDILADQSGRNSLGLYHMKDQGFVRFQAEGMDTFYGFWQPALAGPAPLLIHLPGYGAEVSLHPDLVARGYSVLHVNPLGYNTPAGPDTGKQKAGDWPVLPDTVHSGGERGYKIWLSQCLMAIAWAQRQEAVLADRLSFFGTSQGGGGALLLGSLLRGRGARCVAADVPFLTHFPAGIRAEESGAYQLAVQALARAEDPRAGWFGLGLVDVLSHAGRLELPVLLTACGKDRVCPPATVAALFERLPATRNYCYLAGVSHCYTRESVALAGSWFDLYA